jgi:hypothetical protein
MSQMNMSRLKCSMAAPVSLRDAFAFFENPHNLARITPRWLNFARPVGWPPTSSYKRSSITGKPRPPRS